MRDETVARVDVAERGGGLRGRLRGGSLWGLGLFCLVWAQAAGAGQTGSPPLVPQIPSASQSTSPYSRPQLGKDPVDEPGPLNGTSARKLEHMREDERHKKLVSDTAKLVELTNELKDEVEKASKDELSVDVVRKATEIEKLARDVKERMKS